MPGSRDKRNSSNIPERPVFINLAEIEFPSDSLTVKRLRTLFPDRFDNGSSLSSGFSDFFNPGGVAEAVHLVKLNDIISFERTLADYAFYNAIDPYPSETLNEDCRRDMNEAKSELETLYQQFKLADSPETARLLILQIEEQGARQGQRAKSRRR